MSINKIAILTSGGDAPGMNAAIRAVVRRAESLGIEAYGVEDGYRGLVDGRIRKLEHADVSNILNRGGTFLGSARLPEFKEEAVRAKAVAKLNELGIDALVAIGGDGTYMGAYKLHEMGIKCIGIPATIDNDIASSQFAIGFDTALNTAVEAVDKLRDTSCSHYRAIAIEVMGRYCCDIAIRTAISGGADYVLCKAEDYTKEKLLNTVHEAKKMGKKYMVLVIAEHTVPIDEIVNTLQEDGTYEARGMVLSHVQRGGCPSAADRVLASRLGVYAVELLHQGKTGVCVGIFGEELKYMDIIEAANLPRKVPNKLIEDFKHLL